MKTLVLVLFSILISQSVLSSPVAVEPTEGLNLSGNTKAYVIKDGAISCVIVHMDAISCSLERGMRIDLANTKSADLKFDLKHLSNNVTVAADLQRRVVGNQLCYFMKNGAGVLMSCLNP